MNLRENMSRSMEVLGAYWRQGLHELGAALYGAGTAAQHAEYGMIGTRTPGQVADGLRASDEPSHSRDDGPPAHSTQPSALQAHLDQSKERGEHEPEPLRDEPTLERD